MCQTLETGFLEKTKSQDHLSVKTRLVILLKVDLQNMNLFMLPLRLFLLERVRVRLRRFLIQDFALLFIVTTIWTFLKNQKVKHGMIFFGRTLKEYSPLAYGLSMGIQLGMTMISNHMLAIGVHGAQIVVLQGWILHIIIMPIIWRPGQSMALLTFLMQRMLIGHFIIGQT